MLFLSMIGMGLFPWIVQKLIPQFKETHLGEFLPFKEILEDHKTLYTKNGTFLRLFLLKGADLKTSTQDELLFFEKRKQLFFDAMAERGKVFRFFTKRTRLQIKDSVKFEKSLLQNIHDHWSLQFESTYHTKHYLWIEGESLTEIDALSNLIFDHLSPFHPSLLSNTKDLYASNPLLEFLSTLVNEESSSSAAHHENVSEIMTHSQAFFDLKKGVIEIKMGAQSSFYMVLSIKRWGESSSQEILKELFCLPCEFEILHLCKGFKKLDGRTLLRYRLSQENLIFKNKFKNTEFEKAIHHLEAGHHTLYDYQVTFFIKGDTQEKASDHTSLLKQILLGYEITPVHETDAIEWLWFSRFPGYDHFARPRNLFSHNLASLMSFEAYKEGLPTCDWGNGPLRYFKTHQGNAYGLQIHEGSEKESLAHSLTLAPSGSGKTTFFQHLIGGALRHKNLRAFIFDRFNGVRIFTEALGEAYVDLETNGKILLNPLHCSDTPENRSFLAHFFLTLGKRDDAVSQEIIGRAIDMVFKIPFEYRSLKTLHAYALDQGSALRESFLPWVDGIYSSYLNGLKDCLDFKGARLVSFEMTQILKDPTLSSVLIDYILHRIRQQVRLEACPHLIFIDEAAAMLEDSYFSKNVQTLFREHRKLRGSINVAFQDAHGFFKMPIAETIMNQCSTFFLFQNINARKEDYLPFNLSESEWQFIKGVSALFQIMLNEAFFLKNQKNLSS